MSLLFINGFDLGDSAQKMVMQSGSASSSSTTRFGTGMSVNTSGLDKYIPAANTVFFGAAAYWTFRDNSDRQWVSFYGDNGTVAHITVAFNNNTITVRRGAQGTTLIASYPGPLAMNTWYYLEVSATIHDTTGTVVVKLNGDTVINFTGDTKNAGTNTTIDRVTIGSTLGANFLWDDMYVCDSTGSAPHNTFLGEIRVHSLLPTAAGSSTQWTPDTGANYARVNEAPYSAANYVQATTAGTRDTYTMADLPVTAGTVVAVQSNAVGKKTDAAPASIVSVIKNGANHHTGTPVALSSGVDKTATDLRAINPNTSSPWTISDVNALEAGVEVV